MISRYGLDLRIPKLDSRQERYGNTLRYHLEYEAALLETDVSIEIGCAIGISSAPVIEQNVHRLHQ